MRRIVVFTLVAAVLLPAAPRIAEALDADDLVKQGIALRRKGDDAGALEKFQQAYQVQQSPRTLAQIALAEQALGRWALAHDHVAAALGAGGDTWIAKNRGPLAEALKDIEQHVGKLEVLGGPPGTDVRINGISRGTLPLPAALTVATGSVTIGLAAPGFVPAQRSTIIRAGQITRESFDLLAPVANIDPAPSAAGPRPGAEPSTVAPLATDGTSVPPVEPHDAPNAAPDESEPSRLRLSAKWIAGGIGVAALAGGSIAYVLHKNARDEFGRDCGLNASGDPVHQPSSTVSDATCRDRQSRWNTDYQLSVIGFVAGAAFVAAGVVLWLTEPKTEGSEGRATAFSCVPASSMALTTVAINCRLQF
ncbi:MAG: hypothetical protein ACJ8F1_16670 [Polyangia bacterium]